jgi:hypothetical protein
MLVTSKYKKWFLLKISLKVVNCLTLFSDTNGEKNEKLLSGDFATEEGIILTKYTKFPGKN